MFACKQKTSRIGPIEYAELDLLTSSPGGEIGTSDKMLSPGTEYEQIDFLKTQALASTRQEVETERKQSLDG